MGPVSLLAVLNDNTPGKRKGRDYTHTRYKATLALGPEAGHIANDSSTAERGPR